MKTRPIEITLYVAIITVLTAFQIACTVYVFFIAELSEDFQGLIQVLFARRFLPFSAETVLLIETLMSLISLILVVFLLKPLNRIRIGYCSWTVLTLMYSAFTIQSVSYSGLQLIGCVLLALVLFNPRATRFYRQPE